MVQTMRRTAHQFKQLTITCTKQYILLVSPHLYDLSISFGIRFKCSTEIKPNHAGDAYNNFHRTIASKTTVRQSHDMPILKAQADTTSTTFDYKL